MGGPGELSVSIGYYIAPRPGVRGGKVSWAEMERWLDVRTLGYQYKQDSLWVLFGRLGLDELYHVKEFCADQTSTCGIRRCYGAESIQGHSTVH